MTKFKPLRSVLYMPGNNARAMEKAQNLAADALIFDLEDSVAEGDKSKAREAICTAINQFDYGDRTLVVRVNGIGTSFIEKDMEAVAASGADAVLVPKVSGVESVSIATTMLELAATNSLALWVMIETPLAILNIQSIAAASSASRLGCFVLGTNDLARMTHVETSRGRESMRSWFSSCVLAARAYGLTVLDGPFNDFRDIDGLKIECAEGRALGMDGKTLIHPYQIEPTNTVYRPADEDIAWAERVLSEFNDPANAGENVVAMDGEMVERLHIEIAERIVSASKN